MWWLPLIRFIWLGLCTRAGRPGSLAQTTKGCSEFDKLINTELSRSRWRLPSDEAGEQRNSHSGRRQKARRLAAPVKS